MKRWLIITLIVLLLGCYGVFLGAWFGAAPPAATEAATAPAPETTTGPTTEPTTEPTTAPTTTPTTEPTTAPTTEPPVIVEADIHDLTARHGFVYDLTNEQMLYTHGDQTQQLAPASLTKLFTIYVALEHLAPDTVITAGQEVTWIYEHSSIAAVYQGNRLTVQMLIQGMLMQSGNDAAYALAVAAGRAIAQDEALSAKKALDAFMEQVNLRAEALGLTGTHFVTPDGMGADGHYTTAQDLLAISRLVLQDPLVRQYAACQSQHVTYESGQDYVWTNTNLLLDPQSEYYCADAIGLKTGTTKAAGNCLIALFDTGDRELLVCVLGCPDIPSRFRDALHLYNIYG